MVKIFAYENRYINLLINYYTFIIIDPLKFIWFWMLFSREGYLFHQPCITTSATRTTIHNKKTSILKDFTSCVKEIISFLMF